MVEINNRVKVKFPDAVQSALSAFLFLSFYNCAISVPESYGLVDEAPNEHVRSSLVLVTKFLTTMSSGSQIGDKAEYMTQFNDLVDKNQKELVQFYNSICCVNGGRDTSEFVDTPAKIYSNSISVIATQEKMISTTNNESL